MRIPRSISGKKLLKQLEVFGYVVTRQEGSHARATTDKSGQHHITVPMHTELRVGTLNGIISDVANHFKLTKVDVISKLFE